MTKKTNFSIQPTVNLMPNGNGNTYLMEPSGVNFEKPLQIIFNYAGTNATNNPANLMGIAMQDDKGQWYAVNKTINDTISKTITAGITHFSSYTNYTSSNIIPKSAWVKVNGSLRLKIVTLIPLEEGSDDDLLTPLAETETETPAIWNVNEIARGNSIVGFISASVNRTAIFQAPAKVPQQNPVAVTVVPDYTSAFLRRYGSIKLVCNITIYGDAWEVKMFAFMTGGSNAAWGGIVTYIDEGSFVLSLEKDKPAVINIKNKLETVSYNTCPDRVITNPNTRTGILHVGGVRQIKVIPGNPDPIVEIWFTQYPTELTRFTFNCPPPPSARGSSKGKVDLTTAASGMPPPMLMFFGMPALPTYLKFIAKDEEQVLIEKGSPGDALYYKLWVRKVKEE